MTSLRKHLLIPALLIGFTAPAGLVGCGEESKTTSTIEQKTPDGTTTQETTKKIEQTGDNPPPPADGTDMPK